MRAFCPANGNLRAAEMAQLYIDAIDEIAAGCTEPGPFLFAVTRRGLRLLVRLDQKP